VVDSPNELHMVCVNWTDVREKCLLRKEESAASCRATTSRSPHYGGVVIGASESDC
jgi:hypothetical protein